MGRFHLQFEDQNVPLRKERTIVDSVIFIARTSMTVIVLGSLIGVVVSYVTGDDKIFDRLLAMI